jgi:hypothetical protein
VENEKSKVILNIDADIDWAFPKNVLSCKKKPCSTNKKNNSHNNNNLSNTPTLV